MLFSGTYLGFFNASLTSLNTAHSQWQTQRYGDSSALNVRNGKMCNGLMGLIAYQKRHKQKLAKPLKARETHTTLNSHKQPQGLLPFAKKGKPSPRAHIPFYAEDYIQLLTWTGQAVREDKAGSIPEHITPILERLHINSNEWLSTVQHLEKDFTQAIGRADNIQTYCDNLTRAIQKRKGKLKRKVFSWFRGMNQSRKVFGVAAA